jgi:hypothetical protein
MEMSTPSSRSRRKKKAQKASNYVMDMADDSSTPSRGRRRRSNAFMDLQHNPDSDDNIRDTASVSSNFAALQFDDETAIDFQLDSFDQDESIKLYGSSLSSSTSPRANSKTSLSVRGSVSTLNSPLFSPISNPSSTAPIPVKNKPRKKKKSLTGSYQSGAESDGGFLSPLSKSFNNKHMQHTQSPRRANVNEIAFKRIDKSLRKKFKNSVISNQATKWLENQVLKLLALNVDTLDADLPEYLISTVEQMKNLELPIYDDFASPSLCLFSMHGTELAIETELKTKKSLKGKGKSTLKPTKSGSVTLEHDLLFEDDKDKHDWFYSENLLCVLDIADSLSKLIVHGIAQYYGMQSSVKTFQGKKYTQISLAVNNSQKSNNALPTMKLTEYLQTIKM